MKIKRPDYWLLLPVLFLCFIGLFSLYSVLGSQNRQVFTKQIMWYVISLILLLGSTFTKYELLKKFNYPIYAFSVFLLLLVLIFGKTSGGAQRWLNFIFFSVQPSEISKIAVVITLANFYKDKIKNTSLSLSDLIKPLLSTGLVFLLVIKEPDFGTGILILLVATTMTIFAKPNKKAVLTAVFFCITTTPIFWFSLRNYQKNRVFVFLNPDMDPLGAGYHIMQSKIAIGSGGLTGKGFKEGTQNILSFLPERHTDFIFSVIAKEWGFVGASLVVLSFFFLILRGISIAKNCTDSFGIMLTVGIVAIIAWHVFINIGMVMGIVPVVGISLPFISYGGSSLVTMMLCIGTLLNISKK